MMSKLQLGAVEKGDSKHDETLSEEIEENASKYLKLVSKSKLY